MATTGTKTVLDIVTLGLRKSGIVAFGEVPSSDDAEAARQELELMLKGWQNKGYNLWTKTAGSQALTTAAVYTMSPVRPMRILSARFKKNGIELPMQELTRQEYDDMPQKTTQGTPTTFYYDRQREAARLYVWPVLSAAAGETIEYTYDREVDDVSNLTAVIDVPGEWWDAVVYNLAARLLESVALPKPPALVERAEVLLHEAGAFDREGSIWFGEPC